MIAVGQRVPPALAAVEVLDLDERPRVLATTWSARDVVLVYVRHFACIGCAEHLDVLRPRLAELAQLEVDVVVVGSGTPEQLAAFVEREHLARPGVHCFTDPTLAAYRAAGFVRSRWSTFGPRALGQSVRAFLHGHRNGRPQGDLLQQGGTLYVRRGGEVAFYHRAVSLGDHGRIADVVDIALAARALEASA
jgi:peroxiredoxin